nr:TonB-dependent receptor [uncultured Draconibacterium sp.]
MKKNLNECFPKGKYVRMFKAMKLTMLFIFLGILQVTANNSYSQNARISLDLKDAKLQEVLTEIQKQTEFTFFYSLEDVKDLERIDLEVKEAKLNEVLDECFKNTGLEYEIKHKAIVLKKSLSKKSVTPEDSEKSKIQDQKKVVKGKVVDETQMPMPGVSIIVKGTTVGVISDYEGNFTLEIPEDAEILQFSFVGYKRKEILIDENNFMNVNLEEDIAGIDEVIVIGYGTQKKSDITGAVASVGNEKLEMTPNVNIAQAIQGSIPGVMVQNTSAGASSSQTVMIRGRNSIKASNEPLIVVDGIPYGGNLSDLSLNDVKSIEILKDASAAAIYGSRGSNGVILVTTKQGQLGKPKINYEAKFSIQKYTNMLDMLDGGEFYEFKNTRDATQFTEEELEIYNSGNWVDWPELAIRTGNSQEHNVSISGGTEKVKYYLGASYYDVKGLVVNDDFQRISTRINLETKITDWFSLGTRTQLTLDHADGDSPDSESDAIFTMNPLTTAFDADGNQVIFPYEGKLDGNPLQKVLYDDVDRGYQILSNNYAIVDFPFIQGLKYQINTGIRYRFSDKGSYAGRNTQVGVQSRGTAYTNRSISENVIIENILSYNREIDKHTIFATLLYSSESNKKTSNGFNASGFPNDFLSWYGAGQADVKDPDYSYSKTNMISQMARLNYSFDSRYLLTITARRDGFSGFGTHNKWGVFPSLALGWNLSNEEFFPLNDFFNSLKIRSSYGMNGNQAVGAYETISRLGEENIVSGETTMPGYIPTKLGQDELGWESSKVLNLGIDFSIAEGRFSGALDYYNTRTYDLLLDRTISPVHGITSITQNIGKTKNNGWEATLTTRNIVSAKFNWMTNINFAYNKNEIVSLYGNLDENGNEIDDIANDWFIGQPIRVNYDYVFDGVWQSSEADEAAKWESVPGFIKLMDVDGDYKMTGDDRQIIGQRDPKFLWGMTNTFSYDNFSLSFFIHGVHGITKLNTLLQDNVMTEIRRTTMRKNWWTPDNPSNDFYMNDKDANKMGGVSGLIYEDAGFIRLKDLTLSYDLPQRVIDKLGFDKLRFFVIGRNLITITDWNGLDPELNDQNSFPLQKEFMIGLNLGF